MGFSRVLASAGAAALFFACATGQDVGSTNVQLIGDGGSDSGIAAGGQGGAGAGGSVGGTASGGEPVTGGAPSNGGTSAGGKSSGGSSAGGAAGGGATSKGGTTSMGGRGGTAGSSAGAAGAAGSCNTSEKRCNGSCVSMSPANGCSSPSCDACSISAPTHGVQTCNSSGACDFDCLSGFQKNGSQCVQGTGGAGGAGGQGGAGGAPVVCLIQCIPCTGQTTCCSKSTGFCTCVTPGQESMLCK